MNTNRYIKIIFIAIFNYAFCCAAYAQTANIEYLDDARPAAWVPVATGQKPDSTNVWIRHEVTLDTDATIKSMLIDAGGVLNSAYTAAQGEAYRLTTVSGNSVIWNNGTLGSVSGSKDGIYLTLSSANKNFTLMGSGKTSIASLGIEKANAGLNVTLNQDALFNFPGNAFSAIPPEDALATDEVTFTIETGKTVKITNPNGSFHGKYLYQNGGSYTYNIKGTLDVSASAGMQNIVPLTAASSTVTLNISGLLKLGANLNIGSPTSASGKLVLNVLKGGVVDGIATTNLIHGYNFFTTHGTGVVRRFVGVNTAAFPVGSPGSLTPSPVILFNNNAPGNVSVSVKDQFDVSPPNSTKVVTKQWTIMPDKVTGNNFSAEFYWGLNNLAPGFSKNAPSAVYYRESSSNTWASKPVTIVGSGTYTSPYSASAPALTSGGVFIIQNTDAGEGMAVVSLYPNPADNVVNVDFPATSQKSTMHITNYQGRDMVISPVNKGVTNWKYTISAWPPGFYFLKMTDGDHTSSIKFIKK